MFTDEELEIINVIKEINLGVGKIGTKDDRAIMVGLCGFKLDDYEMLEVWEEIEWNIDAQ